MSKKNVYEIFDEFRAVSMKQDRLDALVRNDSWALRQVLLGAFHPDIKFTVTKIPEYKNEDIPAGMSYGNMNDALSRVYLFVEGNNRVPEGLTEQRKTEILIQILETLEKEEAQVFANMLLKNLKVPHLTAKLVNEAFPGLLPQS